MSVCNNRSTTDLNIHKRLTTLDLIGGNDSKSLVWNRTMDLRVRGGVLVKGGVLSNSLVTSGNLNVESNLCVENFINGRIVGDYTISDYTYEGEFTGNIKGTVTVGSGNVKVIDSFGGVSESSVSSVLGNCITDSDASATVCTLNIDTITFETENTLVGELTASKSLRLGENSQMNAGVQWSFASGAGTATGDFAHVKGYNTIGSEWCHVEGANNVTALHGPIFMTGHQNTSTIGASAGSSPFVNALAAHVEGRDNVYESVTGFDHIEGQNHNVQSSGDAVFVSGSDHYVNNCRNIHVEGLQNTVGPEVASSHIEGRNHLASNVVVSTGSDAVHLEGESHIFENLVQAHLEGSSHSTNYPVQTSHTGVWAGGYQAKINQDYEWVRSGGSITTMGDTQTGIYTMARTQFDTTPRALSKQNVSSVSNAVGITVQDGSVWFADVSIVGRTNDTTGGDYYSVNLSLVVKRESGVYSFDYQKSEERVSGHFVGQPNLVSVGTSGTTTGTFSFLMNGNPGVSQAVYWTAKLITTQVM